MFDSKLLSSGQIELLHRWASEGATMYDLQRRIADEFGLSITYMDTRFLVLDLGIKLVETATEEPKKVEEKPAPVPTGKVTVTMDTLALPGALVSGKVEFSDGETAIWMLDQSGRPGLDPDTAGYRPAQSDIVEFQKQLRTLLENSGRY